MIRKTLSLLVLLLTTLLGGQAAAQNAEVSEGEGVVQKMLFETNKVVIDGVQYRVAFDARVEIRGSYGAYSMLQKGMKVLFEYRRFSPTELEIFAIEQLPDNRVIEES